MKTYTIILKNEGCPDAEVIIEAESMEEAIKKLYEGKLYQGN